MTSWTSSTSGEATVEFFAAKSNEYHCARDPIRESDSDVRKVSATLQCKGCRPTSLVCLSLVWHLFSARIREADRLEYIWCRGT